MTAIAVTLRAIVFITHPPTKTLPFASTGTDIFSPSLALHLHVAYARPIIEPVSR